MSAERGRRDYPLKARPRGWGLSAPAWCLHMRLRWSCNGIARIERQLADEFGVVETAPLHRELDALCAERDALLRRLTARS